MSNNGHYEQEIEDSAGIEDIYEQEPREVTEGVNPTPDTSVLTQNPVYVHGCLP